MRASTAVVILTLVAGVAQSVALALAAFEYASLSCCICDAQALSFFADLGVSICTLSYARPGHAH
jgi:hypothetical protein